MNTNEKILLVQLLLEDLEDNYTYKPDKRAAKAKSLCEEITKETQNDDYLILADFCDSYIKTGKQWDDWDGRFFRNPFPMGYKRMDILHNLKPTFNNKSNDFKTVVKEYMTNPELRFGDWNNIVI